MGSKEGRLTPDSDDWWVNRLVGKLMDDQERVKDLEERYQKGYLPKQFKQLIEKDAFERFLSISRMNLASLVVDTMASRMKPLAFRTASDKDENGDEQAFQIMRRCDLEQTFDEILAWSLITGRSYGMVTKVDGKSWITSEHPSQVYSEQDPITRRVVAAVKVYRDEVKEQDVVVLYRKDYQVVYTLEAEFTTITRSPMWNLDFEEWTSGPRVKTGTSSPAIVPFGDGRGEIEPHTGALDRVNHTLMQRLVVISYQAFRQRGIKGVPNTDAQGQEIDYSSIFTSDPGSLWLLPPNAEMWESAQADLTPILTAVRDDIKDLAVESRTPLYSITPDAANGSAEGATLQRETHIAKIEKRLARLNGPLRQLMAMAFEIDGDKERSKVEEIEVIWDDPAKASLTERAASAAQASQAGVPWRYVMTHFVKMTPKELAEAERDRQKDQMMGALNGPQPAASDARVEQPGARATDEGTPGGAQKPLAAPKSAN